MKKSLIKIIINRLLLVLFIVLVVIQFFRPAKNTSNTPTGIEITRVFQVPDTIQHLLQIACYDCHSNNTHYPWYDRVQPIAFWLNNHIEEGKHHVNFSAFANYTIEKQVKKLRKCAHEIEEGDMPMNYYLWIHKEAVLNDAQRKLLTDWMRNQADKLAPLQSETK